MSNHEKGTATEKISAVPISTEQARVDYSVFSTPQKRWIVFIAAFSAWFSTLSSFIFFPAITSLSHSLNASIQNINLTVTSYLLVGAVAPALTATLADQYGRRPAFMLSFAIYVSANIGLALQSSFAALFVLRMVQSFGVAGTFAIAYGVLADVVTPAERGSYVGVVAFCTNTAPSMGPVVGAALNSSLGWRAIFWFLTAASGLCLLLIILTLPETSRAIVGNGSTPAAGVYKAPISSFRPAMLSPETEKQVRPKTTARTFLNSYFQTLKQKDKLTVMCAIAILYMTWNCLQASLSTLFIEIYHFSYLKAGLIYIPFGVGVGCSGYLTGRLLDHDYKLVAKQHHLHTDRTAGDNLANFPIEHARLRSANLPLAVACAALIAYGWCLHFKVHFAVNLVLQLLLGISLQVCFTSLNTLLTDISPASPSTSQATSNLLRCLLAAGALACLQDVLDAIGPGWTFSIVAGLTSLCFVLLWLEKRHGADWRMERLARGT